MTEDAPQTDLDAMARRTEVFLEIKKPKDYKKKLETVGVPFSKENFDDELIKEEKKSLKTKKTLYHSIERDDTSGQKGYFL